MEYFEVEQPGRIVYKPVPDFQVFTLDEIVVERVGCGICRSDVGVFDGREAIPPDMFGHESYGVVVEGGSGFKIGDLVASYWHPGYASYYKAPAKTCVRIPDLSPKWAIVQPLASVINALDYAEGDTLVIGRGFTASLLRSIRDSNPKASLFFEDEVRPADSQWHCCIEMSGRGLPPYNWFQDEAKMIWFSTLQEPVTTNLFEFSWKAMTVHFPSPRQAVMSRNMARAVELLKDFEPVITHVFDFSKAQEAFEIASNRTDGYFKGVFVEEEYVQDYEEFLIRRQSPVAELA